MDHARSIGLGWLDVIQPRQRTELLGRLLDKDAPTDADSLVYTLTCGQSVCEMLAACHDLQGRRIGNMAFIGKMLPPATTASADAHSPAKLSNPNFYGLGRYDPTIHAAAALVNDVSLPLMATTAYAQAAQNHIASGLASDYGSASRALAHAVQQSVQAVSHLRRLRAVLSQGQTYFEPTDLGDLLETAIKDTQPLRQHLGIHLDTMLHDGPCLANLQASQIYEVLKQLISLGFDRAKTSQSGKACITLRRLPDDQWQITIEATGLTDTPRTPDVNADETSLAIASARTILWAHDGKLVLGPSTPSSNAPVFSILIPCLAED